MPATSFGPYAILFQFPSGEWSVESYSDGLSARKAAARAAEEEPGRLVHVLKHMRSAEYSPQVNWHDVDPS